MANITKKDVIIAVVFGLLGFGGGVAFVGATKAAQLADDIHGVKQDIDKSKHRLKKDYTHITDKELRNIHKKFHGKKRGED